MISSNEESEEWVQSYVARSLRVTSRSEASLEGNFTEDLEWREEQRPTRHVSVIGVHEQLQGL